MTENLIKSELKNRGAHFIHFVDISHLSTEQNKGFPNSILFGIVLSPWYLATVSKTPDYVKRMVKSKQIEDDEFHVTELKTDAMADFLADYINQKGFSAYSQSEKNLEDTGSYDPVYQTTPLPHKTIALLAGLGWIGKNNLLVTEEYGSAISMCTVLTDAPLKSLSKQIMKSKCGECNLCIKVCKSDSLSGKSWTKGIIREEILNIRTCTTCLNCMVVCPWTQNYFK
ncbi:MAG: 4Fe-4S dicluster domain-containing protein [Draconibacterium sp.]|nr:4Fe-4S dicluster domain-containing protein [Draconibacterium sp.]